MVANAGDSRAVICRAGGLAEPLSFDHKPFHVSFAYVIDILNTILLVLTSCLLTISSCTTFSYVPFLITCIDVNLES